MQQFVVLQINDLHFLYKDYICPMQKQKLGSALLLGLLLLVASVYSAHVFVGKQNSIVDFANVSQQDDTPDNENEGAKEGAQFILFAEKLPHYLKPLNPLSITYNNEIFHLLPEAYTQLHTPPPDLT
jgi:hypothetical protein